MSSIGEDRVASHLPERLDDDEIGEVVQVDERFEHLLVERALLAEVVADGRLAQSLAPNVLSNVRDSFKNKRTPRRRPHKTNATVDLVANRRRRRRQRRPHKPFSLGSL